ncbi:predicted protein [Uncinocarpus reesii 1704]|uniref:Uncharacterized protein n=1 Tax=Uncinocarpus reesii (strain UAMH 1704) TaxID=336963 RepID=C4JG95_UNCRE|nr:uncharacterized protein UREG_02493 [Uncinocarpus reesii 1704]EEP77644.1 predicted protein [Uncinocarpus reesii 1704]
MPPLDAITENIALLGLLDAKEPEARNNVPAKFTDEKYAARFPLSFKEEQRTAEAFAILLANTDDCKKVGAVCVEQQPDGHGLVIRTAVNCGNQTARRDIFTKIIRALKKASSSLIRSARKRCWTTSSAPASYACLVGFGRAMRRLHGKASKRLFYPSFAIT